MKPAPIYECVITEHAFLEMKRRNISSEQVRSVLEKPEQRQTLRKGREVFQSRSDIEGKQYWVRVFVDIDRLPAEVMTVYKTSKIEKYWRPGS